MNLRQQAATSFALKIQRRIQLARLRRAYQAACVKGVTDAARYKAWLELSMFVDKENNYGSR